MDMVKGAISDQVMGQLGGMLGMEDQKKTSSAFETVTQSILGGLINKSSSQEGAKQVFDMTQNADPGILDKLGDILGGGGQQVEAVQNAGSGMLEGILGGGGQSTMIQTLSKFLGLDKSIIGKLLTMAAPFLLGAIAKHVKSAGLDALGLSSLLGEQKQHLAAAMPSGLSNDLGFGNLLSGAGNVGQSAANAATNAANEVRNAAPTGGSGGVMKWLIPLVGLIALGYLALQFLGGGAAEQGKDLVDQGKGAIAGAADGLEFKGLDLGVLGDTGTKLQEGFGSITDGFAGLKDSGEDGANKLVGTINDFSGSIDGMNLGDLPETGKSVASTMIGKFVETVKSLLGGQSESVQGILKPAIDLLMEKFKAFM
jgi:hypothetical protein